MNICSLHIDLVGVVLLIQEIIFLYVSLSIESAEKQSLAHAFSSKASAWDLEDIGRLRKKRGTRSMADHLEDVSKTVRAGS